MKKRDPLPLAMILIGALIAGLVLATVVLSQPRTGNMLHVRDVDLDATLEIVTADTGFSQMASDAVIRVAFSPESRFDSLNAGSAGTNNGTLTAAWSGGSTADASANNNFFRNYSGLGTVASVTGVFSNAWSARSAAYLLRREDTDFRVAGNWGVSGFVGRFASGNPSATEIVFSAFESPDAMQIGIDVNGNLFTRLSDDGRATWDSVGVTGDIADSTYHFFHFRTRSTSADLDSLLLNVDNYARAQVKFSNAETGLTLDTVSVFAYRGASTCRCRGERFWYMEDTVSVNQDMRRYAWRAMRETGSQAADSTRIYIAGIGTDSTHRDTTMKVPVRSSIATSRTWHAFESAYLDSNEAMPVIVYTSGTSPRSTKLDSIPTGRLEYDIAQVLFGRKDQGYLEWVQLHHETAVDTTVWEVRVYPSIEDSRDLSSGYYVPVSARLFAGQNQLRQDLGIPSNGGMIVVYGRSVAGNAIGSATLKYRRN